MDQERAHAGNIRRLKGAAHGVGDQSDPQPLALPDLVNRQCIFLDEGFLCISSCLSHKSGA